MLRTCIKCSAAKPLLLYPKDKKSLSGFRRTCKECWARQQKKRNNALPCIICGTSETEICVACGVLLKYEAVKLFRAATYVQEKQNPQKRNEVIDIQSHDEATPQILDTDNTTFQPQLIDLDALRNW